MQAHQKKQPESLYEEDFQLWLEETVGQLRSQKFDQIDWENLIEEIESLGKSDKRAILSYLTRLCEHLLKVMYWDTEREACLRGWTREIANFRLEIKAILKDSPSLKNYLQSEFLPAYANGRKLFLNASGLNADTVPQNPCFSLTQALDENWLP
jgi:hypothetical protein